MQNHAETLKLKTQFWTRSVRNWTKSRNMDMSIISQKLQVRAKPSRKTCPFFVWRPYAPIEGETLQKNNTFFTWIYTWIFKWIYICVNARGEAEKHINLYRNDHIYMNNGPGPRQITKVHKKLPCSWACYESLALGTPLSRRRWYQIVGGGHGGKRCRC